MRECLDCGFQVYGRQKYCALCTTKRANAAKKRYEERLDAAFREMTDETGPSMPTHKFVDFLIAKVSL